VENLDHVIPGCRPERAILMYEAPQLLYERIHNALPNDCDFVAHHGFNAELLDDKRNFELNDPDRCTLLMLDDVQVCAELRRCVVPQNKLKLASRRDTPPVRGVAACQRIICIIAGGMSQVSSIWQTVQNWTSPRQQAISSLFA